MTAIDTLPEPPRDATTQARFVALCAASLDSGGFESLLLSRHCGPDTDLSRVTVRPIVLRGSPFLSFVYRYKTRDETKNLTPAEGLGRVRELLGGVFRHAHLHTRDEVVELMISRRGVCTLRRRPAASSDAARTLAREAATSRQGHDHDKRRFVDVTRPFLSALGVTTAQHTVVPAMSRKWKQINKFVEIFAGAARASHLLDPGTPVPSGKRPVRWSTSAPARAT